MFVGVGISVDVEVADAVEVAVGAFEVGVGELVMDGVKVGPPGVIVSVEVGPPGVFVRVAVEAPGVFDDDAFDVSVGVLVSVGVEDGPPGDFVRVKTGATVKVRVGFLIVPGGKTTMVNVGNGVEVGKKVGRAVGVSVNTGANVEVDVNVSVAAGGLAFLERNKMPSRIVTPHTNSRRINTMVATWVERLLKLTFIGVKPFLYCARYCKVYLESGGSSPDHRKVNFALRPNGFDLNCKMPGRQKNSPR